MCSKLTCTEDEWIGLCKHIVKSNDNNNNININASARTKLGWVYFLHWEKKRVAKFTHERKNERFQTTQKTQPHTHTNTQKKKHEHCTCFVCRANYAIMSCWVWPIVGFVVFLFSLDNLSKVNLLCCKICAFWYSQNWKKTRVYKAQ